MKLLRYGPEGAERPGLLDGEGRIRDLSGVVDDIAGATLISTGLDRLRAIAPSSLPLAPEGARLGPCVGRPGKLMCIGLNYSDHAAEAGMERPAEPVLFSKYTSAMCGPHDDIVIPRGSSKTDWEVELGVVIGNPGKHIATEQALDHVAGYCVINDISERSFQLEGTGQWVKGKSCDTFAPTGPWLVTADEVPDPQNLSLWLDVDGHRYQNGNTGRMIFPVARIISYLSRYFTLEAGDVIATGTPPGVGMGQKPDPVFLRPGQIMRLGVAGLGEQRLRTVAET